MRSDQRGQRGEGGRPVLRLHRADHQILRSNFGWIIGDFKPDGPAAVPFVDAQPVAPDRRHSFARATSFGENPARASENTTALPMAPAPTIVIERASVMVFTLSLHLSGAAICWCKSSRSRLPKRLLR